jgi:ribosome biogenesis GTPase
MSVAQPAPQWQLLDRYLASVEVSELAALICLTKLDLIRGADSEKTILRHAEEYSALGYTVLLTSAGSGEGIDALRDKLAGKLSVLIGKSGVGKTSLLNALQPGLGQRVGAVNTQLNKGRHTTLKCSDWKAVAILSIRQV